VDLKPATVVGAHASVASLPLLGAAPLSLIGTLPYRTPTALAAAPASKKHQAPLSPVSFPCTPFSPPTGTRTKPPPPLVRAGAEVHHRRRRSRSRHHLNHPLSVSSLHGSPPSLISRRLTLSSLPRSFRCSPPPLTATRGHRCHGTPPRYPLPPPL
jgi:hypothetical protein